MKKMFFIQAFGLLFFLSGCANDATDGDKGTTDSLTTDTAQAKERKKLTFRASRRCFDVNDPCDDEANWCTPNCVDRILDCHKVDSDTVVQWINNYAQGIPPKVIDASTVSATIGNACSGALTFEAYDDNTTNQDINMGITDTTIRIEYSPALFKGIIASKSPESFHFYKASHTVDGVQKTYIVFIAVKKIQGVETAVYVGDVSDAIP
jgi:hypothetical protein